MSGFRDLKITPRWSCGQNCIHFYLHKIGLKTLREERRENKDNLTGKLLLLRDQCKKGPRKPPGQIPNALKLSKCRLWNEKNYQQKNHKIHRMQESMKFRTFLDFLYTKTRENMFIVSFESFKIFYHLKISEALNIYTKICS